MKQTNATGFKKHLPNITSIIRLLGAFSLLFLMNFRMDLGAFRAVPWIWLIVYLFLVIADYLDGALARKLNAKSELGALLDALSDAALLVVGAATVFVRFAYANLTVFETWLYVCLLIFCTANRLSMNLVAKKFFGTPNMVHSYPQKAFTVCCYFGVAFWAFLLDVPWWSIVFLLSLNLYGAIDEVVYCSRAATYDVNFKGHGFQKYELRKKP